MDMVVVVVVNAIVPLSSSSWDDLTVTFVNPNRRVAVVALRANLVRSYLMDRQEDLTSSSWSYAIAVGAMYMWSVMVVHPALTMVGTMADASSSQS